MGKNIYVGNLSYSLSAADLEQLFGQYGQVSSAKIISDRETGRSKGFGFVEMDDAGQADAAIAELNNKEYEGRNMVVNEAKPREPRSGGFRGGDRRGGGGGGRRY